MVRSKAIARILQKENAQEVLGLNTKLRSTIKGISSNRKYVDKNGIMSSDTVFVALEDGDRTESLVKMGKKVISIDLNPLSRTAIASNVTIIDNIVRAIPNMISISKELENRDRSYLLQQIKNFDNIQNMHESLRMIRRGV